MSRVASVIPLPEYEKIVERLVDLLKAESNDAAAATYALSLTESGAITQEIAYELFKEAILRAYWD